LVGFADLVIDEVNTIPFFAKFYVKEKNILFIYQLCREIWFYQIFFPFNLIGYLLEPIYLRMLNNKNVITESQSTKDDLGNYGFDKNKIDIISMSSHVKAISNNDFKNQKKFKNQTLLSLGSVRPMKQTIDILKAFELAKKKNRNLQLIVAGDLSHKYGLKLLNLVKKSQYKKDIKILGRISKEKKQELLQKCHLTIVTSVKEGWGLVITESNSQGTPALVYNADGLRDAVFKNKNLMAEKNNPKEMSNKIVELLDNKEMYEELREFGYQKVREMSFEKTYQDFLKIIC
jgi:glycosyltransferase involved in cell wall biosynthesis